MISHIEVKDPEKSFTPWWPKMPWLAQIDRLEFKPGLNVMFGPNMTGKSTVLKAMAHALCCYDGGQQLVGKYTPGHQTGIAVYHDGGPVMFSDPSRIPGVIEGGGAFDFDFMDQGLDYFRTKTSEGEGNLRRMTRHINAMDSGNWPEIKWKVGQEYQPERVAFLAGNIEGDRRPTMLLDEPTRSFAFMAAHRFLLRLPIWAKQCQIIIATHSPFALYLEGAHYIETEPDYVERARLFLRGVFA